MIALLSSLALSANTSAFATTPSQIGPVQVIPGVSGLASVSCNGKDFCVAVGTGADGGEVLPITDGTPGVVQVVTGSDQDLFDLVLSSVACQGPSSCVAAGSAWAPYVAGLKQQVGVLVPITDGVPQGEVTIMGQGTPGTADYVSLSAVSCYVSTCVAVGTDNYLGPIIVPFNAAETVAPIAGGYFNGIACHGDGACVSVGFFGTYVSDGYSGMLPIEQGAAAGQGKGIDASAAVACRWSHTCIAVGSESSGSATVGDVVTITKRSPGADNIVTGTSALYSAACAGPKYCVAAGSNSSNEGVLVTVAGPRVHTPDVVAGSTSLGSVACSNVGFCIAIGGNSEGQTVFTTFGLPTG
jgi:hypothetical protein